MMKKDDVCEVDYYKKSIIQMIEKIERKGTIEYLHTFIKLFIEKWG